MRTLTTIFIYGAVTLSAGSADLRAQQSAATVTPTAGTPQSAPINALFTTSLQATVKDSAGKPVPAADVTFTAPASGAGGTFVSASATATVKTDANGVATAPALLANDKTGSFTVTAIVKGGPGTNFSLSNSSGTAAIVTATTRMAQSAAVSAQFAAPLQVIVKDAAGSPVSGAVVTFTAPAASGAGGTFPGGPTATAQTGANGVATAPPFTANGTAGAYTVMAGASGAAPGSFPLMNTAAPPASMTVAAGTTPQSAPPGALFGTPLQVTVKDSGGRTLSGVAVTFSAPVGAGASGAFSGAGQTVTASTDTNGVATAPAFIANAAMGSYTVTAIVAGGPGVNFSLTNSSSPPAAVTATGTPQSAPTNTAFQTPLTAHVTDAAATPNPVSGVVVTFTAPASGASGTFPGGVQSVTAITNASGVATAPPLTANGTAGSFTVTAAVPGVATPASYTLAQGMPVHLIGRVAEGTTALNGVATPSATIQFFDVVSKDFIQLQGGGSSSVQAESTGAFSATLASPLYGGQQVRIEQRLNGIPVGPPDPIVNVRGIADWGRVRANFAAGAVLSTDNGFQGQSTLFMDFNLEKNWVWGGLSKDPSDSVWDRRWMWNTFFETRLTSVPESQSPTPSTNTGAGGTPPSGTAGNDVLSTFIASRKSAVLQVGNYFPFLTNHWTWQKVPNALFIAPLAKIGFITPISDAATQNSSGTPTQPVNAGQFFNFYGFGGRVGHFKLSRDRNSAPELISYLDVIYGRFSNLETLVPVDNMFQADGKTPLTRPVRRYRLGVEGLLKVPATPFVLGFSANIGQNLRTQTVGQPPKDDLRFFIGAKFDVGKLFAQIQQF